MTRRDEEWEQDYHERSARLLDAQLKCGRDGHETIEHKGKSICRLCGAEAWLRPDD